MAVNYLQHSRKGTSWKKENADYTKKKGKRYYYDYERVQKKLWKLKKKVGESDEYKKMKQDMEENRVKTKARHKSQGNEDIANTYRDVASVYSSLGGHETARELNQKANEYQRRANDAKPKHTKPNKALNSTSDALNRAKRMGHKKLREVSKPLIAKGKSLVDKMLKRK